MCHKISDAYLIGSTIGDRLIDLMLKYQISFLKCFRETEMVIDYGKAIDYGKTIEVEAFAMNVLGKIL